MPMRMLTVLVVSLAVLLPLRAATAAETISSFDSVVELARDGSMLVTETITATSEGRDIRRGIFRDFPLTFLDSQGRTASVDFEVVSVERDGEPEQWRTERIANGIRIYIGRADVFLRPGEHRFQITYRTDRQVRYFADHDELYWNVTGNGWIFPIERATATITLPEGVEATETTYYTGAYGSTEKNARVMEEDGEIFFSTTRPLGPGEGLTVAVKLPKGAIEPPDVSQAWLWYLRDNINNVIGLGGLFLVFTYYTRAWMRVGRDPARGVMVPRWDPPDGISPALVNYIDNKGFSGQGWTAIAATALDLAVRGYVVLEDLKNSIVIRRTDKPAEAKMQAGETALLDALGNSGGTLTIDRANGPQVAKVGRGFRASMEREHRDRYYRANTLYIVGGAVLSAAVIAALFLFGSMDENLVGLLIVSVVVSIFIGAFAVGFGKNVRGSSSLPGRIIAIVALGFACFVGFSVLSGVLATLYFSMVEAHETLVLVAIGGIVLLNVLYFFLMGAPTPLGARMMDGIDGLRQYMTLAEQDRMNMAGAPEMSPRHFETLLPYAVALGVEKPWTETFETWLATAAAGAAAASYAPAWYGGNFRSGRFADRIGGFSTSMASTMASTIPAPQARSSSGFGGGGRSGGGGFSGGGGGGGGGGGW
ncbi:DUF2207 domain-containing protein [Rhizobiaceae bacterium n13]|uniref:DUF2207 domain-containing protein n=1 Tax=Ferirhizobium litorale TaxID=2927786 RepID=A0AAE3QD40_9HYPH|nr:DUF2207 domain-containing protein [Fererhizobium litorale]MDI7861492.1 DUF2207 domain-containing protein [Fererhizobium litorale]MDI7921638.1 DUF2207 domain-containing protein [Fererhizobium litorale]